MALSWDIFKKDRILTLMYNSAQNAGVSIKKNVMRVTPDL